ncbi:MAG: hypothetical protein ABIJ00_05495 [Candidatus Eisenbacteria bacterium]
MTVKSKTVSIGTFTKQVARIAPVELTYKDQIRFSAGDVRTLIVIPHADELFGHAEWYMVLDLSPNEQSPQLTVAKELAVGSESVTYHYGVYCEGDDDFAEGQASSPVMLIGPP